MKKKLLKVGAKLGKGQPPFLWSIGILDVAFAEAKEFLTDSQYKHLRLQVQELARCPEPTTSETIDVRPVETFHELRDKGGILGNLNVRLFFGVQKDDIRAIVILGVINKKTDGKTPQGTKTLMKRRWRNYQNGDYGRLPL